MSTENSKTAQDVMCKDVAWVAPATSLIEVAKKMQASDCGCILVGENDRLTGVITDRDIVLRCIAAGKSLDQCKASDTMTAKVLYCLQSDSLDSVAQNMADNQVRRLVVLDDNKRMVGIVSLGDVACSSVSESVTGSALGEICRSDMKKAA